MSLVMKNKITGRGALKAEASVLVEHDELVDAKVNNVERDLIFCWVIIIEDKLEKEFSIKNYSFFFF
jgi:hypothetical protein